MDVLELIHVSRRHSRLAAFGRLRHSFTSLPLDDAFSLQRGCNTQPPMGSQQLVQTLASSELVNYSNCRNHANRVHILSVHPSSC